MKLKTTDNCSSEVTGGSDTSLCSTAQALPKSSPTVQLARMKGDIQAFEDSLEASSYKKNALQEWPF